MSKQANKLDPIREFKAVMTGIRRLEHKFERRPHSNPLCTVARVRLYKKYLSLSERSTHLYEVITTSMALAAAGSTK